MTSLIQRRNRIDSSRRFGGFFLWSGAFFIAIWLVFALWQGFHVFTFIELVVGLCFIAQGVLRRRAASKAEAALDAEHGSNAGMQEPV